MRIVIAPDKFKGCLSATQVAAAMAAGVRKGAPDAQVDRGPVADGGEGFVAAMLAAMGGRTVTTRVTGPLPDMKVNADYALVDNGRTAVVEMSAASGLHLLPVELRNPMLTTTYGTGELLMHAACTPGVQTILLGIGGSATVDGGIGCCQACGLPVILDGDGPADVREPLTAGDLDRVVLVKHGRGSPVERVRIRVACDVDNPLSGPHGAARVFGPQKGATPRQVEQLDHLLSELARRCGKQAQASAPGAGAAGGLGFALLALFPNATLEPGAQLVLDALQFQQRITGAALCLTGEGRLDASTLRGKAPHAVASACRAATVPCAAVAGAIDGDSIDALLEQFTACFSLADGPMSPQQSVARATELLERVARNVARLARSACA